MHCSECERKVMISPIVESIGIYIYSANGVDVTDSHDEYIAKYHNDNFTKKMIDEYDKFPFWGNYAGRLPMSCLHFLIANPHFYIGYLSAESISEHATVDYDWVSYTTQIVKHVIMTSQAVTNLRPKLEALTTLGINYLDCKLDFINSIPASVFENVCRSLPMLFELGFEFDSQIVNSHTSTIALNYYEILKLETWCIDKLVEYGFDFYNVILSNGKYLPTLSKRQMKNLVQYVEPEIIAKLILSDTDKKRQLISLVKNYDVDLTSVVRSMDEN
jgi:hypothetical protein